MKTNGKKREEEKCGESTSKLVQDKNTAKFKCKRGIETVLIQLEIKTTINDQNSSFQLAFNQSNATTVLLKTGFKYVQVSDPRRITQGECIHRV